MYLQFIVGIALSNVGVDKHVTQECIYIEPPSWQASGFSSPSPTDQPPPPPPPPPQYLESIVHWILSDNSSPKRPALYPQVNVQVFIPTIPGIKTCILTNNWLDDTQPQTTVSALAPLAHYFDEVFESSKLGLRKPNPEVYKLVCSRMGFKPSQVGVLFQLCCRHTLGIVWSCV